MPWKAETVGDHVSLTPPDSGTWALDADAALDLGDDLIIAALGIMEKQGKLRWRHGWRLVHSDVAQDAEGEDEDGHGEPSQADAAGEVAGGQDRGDEVKQDGQHGG